MNTTDSSQLSPTPERKSKLAMISRLFKPWTWTRKKKPSEKIEKQATNIERKISTRSTREELIKRGILKEIDENAPVEPTIPEESNEVDLSGDVSRDVCQLKISNSPSPSADNSISLSPSPVVNANVSLSSSGDGDSINKLPEAVTDLPVSLHTTDSAKTAIAVLPEEYQTSAPDAAVNNSTPLSLPLSVSVSYQPEDNQISLSYSPGVMGPAATQNSQEVDAVPLPSNGYRSIPINEPDLSKVPARSALKGGRTRADLQGHLEHKSQDKEHTSGSNVSSNVSIAGVQFSGSDQVHIQDVVKIPPKVAPKPRGSLKQAVDVATNADAVDSTINVNVQTDVKPPIDDDDDDNSQLTGLAAKVQRHDSLANTLNRKSAEQNQPVIEVTSPSSDDTLAARQQIGAKLNRRLSLRPTMEELEERHILLKRTPDELKQEMEEKKRVLIRKLSFRPTIGELKEMKIIKFNDYVEVTEAIVVDRRADKPWTRLTPRDKAAIRKELNEFKGTEMDVHEESKQFTRFHRP